MTYKLEFDENGRVIVPKTDEEKVAEAEDEIKEIWNELNFDCGSFFNSMSFIGGINGRKNKYYLYKRDNLFMLSTGFSEEKPTRVNFIFNEEIIFLKSFIEITYKKQGIIGAPISLVMDTLKDNLESIPKNLSRLKIICNLYKLGIDVDRLFYSFMLSSFYILSIIEDKFSIDQDRKKYILEIGKYEKDDMIDIYKSSKIIGFDRRRVIFWKNKFNFVVSVRRPFRGICYVYDEREIKHISELIEMEELLKEDIWKDRREIDCVKMLDYINQHQGDICLVCYREIMKRNIRNNKDQFEYTDSRLKLALKIIRIVNKNIIIDKEGRKNRYFKKKVILNT